MLPFSNHTGSINDHLLTQVDKSSTFISKSYVIWHQETKYMYGAFYMAIYAPQMAVNTRYGYNVIPGTLL